MVSATVIGPAHTPGSLLRDADAAESSHQGRSGSVVRPGSGSYRGDDGDELVWWKWRLTWSRGAAFVRQFSFEREEEDIAYALFATFPSHGSEMRKGKDVDLGSSDTFGPFHNSQSAKWGAPQTAASTSSHPSSHHATSNTAVVVFLQTRAYVYFPSGHTACVHLPYPVERAWALPEGGILVQRALGRRKRQALGRSGRVLDGMSYGPSSVLDEFGSGAGVRERPETQPRLSVLMGPMEEFKAVVQGAVQLETGGYSLVHSADIGADHTVLLSAASPPFVVLYSRHSGKIIFTRRVTVPIAPTPPPPLSGTTPRTLRPADLLKADAPAVPPFSRPSLARNPSSFAGDRRSSGLADPLTRDERNGPRLARISDTHPGPGELQRALDPAVLPSKLNKGKMKARVTEERRRGRESDVSVIVRESADQGLRAAVPRTRADEWDMNLRETTMLMGLERDEVDRSEIVLDTLWAWQPPSGFDPDTANVFLSDNLSASQVQINIHSPELGQLDTFTASLHPNDRWQISPRDPIPALSAVPVIASRPNVSDILILSPEGHLRILTSFGQSIPLTIALPAAQDEVAHKLASSLHMTIDEDDRMAGARNSSNIVRLEEGHGSAFIAVTGHGERYRCSANLTLPDGLARTAMDALSYALPNQEFFRLKQDFIEERARTPAGDDPWEILERTLNRAFGIPSRPPPSMAMDQLVQSALHSSDPVIARLASKRTRALSTVASASPEPTLSPAYIPHAVMALHLTGQDCRLRLSGQRDVRRIAVLIRPLAAAVARLDWVDYWMRISPGPSTPSIPERFDIDTSILDRFQQPPDILSYLARRFSRPLKPFPSPSSIFGTQSEYGTPLLCHETQLIIDIFDRLGAPAHALVARVSAADRAHATVHYMVQHNLGSDWLADRPACIALPILEMMKLCQMMPKRDMSGGLYDLVGRSDLQLQLQRGVDVYNRPEQNTAEGIPSVGDLMKCATSRTEAVGLPHVRFGADRRLREVERIMQASRIRSVAINTYGGSDAEIAQQQQSMVNTIAQRTLAVLVGQGIFEYGTRSTAITDTWDIPLIELSVKLSPANTALKAQIHQDHVDWPCFHNGVASALAISADAEGIDSAWIVLNKPAPLNPEHGGFLLGLGLTGHLRKLKTYHAFPYMEARHDFTSVGLLLGLASSYAGSEDMLITKTLSLHTHALLPMGSMALNAPPVVQSSALVGLGLVYAGSKNLRMAEVTLGEIGRTEMTGIDHFTDYQEAYSFSAAAAFGLIMLGRGGQAASEVDRRMLGKLSRCIHSDSPSAPKGAIPTETTITGPGATLALALMYLKTKRADIRDMLEIPTTTLALDSVRPDLLLLRTFARGLIMWDTVAPTMSWIDEQLPPFIRAQVTDHKRFGGLELAVDLAYINIVAGACLAIGLKFAGTASEMAHNNLMFFFHVLSRTAGSGSNAYEAKIRRSAARQALNVVTIAVCCVMSGTGELQVLRRLRISHGQEGVGVTYGTHMAMHMAVGLLFLGRGQYTLGTNDLAIAAMSIAFFPRFMHTPDDNRAYPQAFRHLWALAVEPRCLMARDVDSGETVYLPIKVRLREGDTIRSQNLISPTLIAPFGNLVSIEVDSPRYWPITYDFTDPAHRAALVKTRTIHVKRRAGHQDYNSDPKGNRSIFIRAGGVTGFDLHYDLLSPAAPPSVPAAEVCDLIKQHSPVRWHAELAALLSGEGDSKGDEYSKFIRTVLLECVTLDKPLTLMVYMGLIAGGRGAEGARDVEMLKHFYAKVWDPAGSTLAERRIALLRPAFLAALTRRGGEVDARAKSVYFAEGRWEAEDADGLAEWLVRAHVPPQPLLAALKEKVRGDVAARTVDGDRGMLEEKVKSVARSYEGNLGRVWDEVQETSGEVSQGRWKADSVREAISAWLA